MASSAFFLAARRLRPPILAIVAVFAVGMVGLTLIPGVDEQGQAWRMTVFQALYFMAYTATTIGFGEIPRAFTDTQRLWVTAVIFASVVAWAYLLASVLALARDPAFRAARVAGRVRRQVRRLTEPFYLICGFGETGMLVARALDRLNYRFALVDIDPARIEEAELADFSQDPPALTADAKIPENLIAAGLKRDACRGVLALTNDDQANLAVAMALRLLHPSIPVLARAMSRETAANMASFGTDHIINPFAKFGEYLALAIASPGSYRLLSWLTGLPGTTLEPETAPPRGHWVVCGYGRFGREVVQAFRGHGMDVTIVEKQGSEKSVLEEAGIERAVGIVAGTDDDVTNLSIAVTARELHPRIFTILRQNLQANRELFSAYRADILMVSSEIIADECLALIRTPLLGRFLAVVRSQSDAWADGVIARLQTSLGNDTPEIWSVALTAAGRAGAAPCARIRTHDSHRRRPAPRSARSFAAPGMRSAVPVEFRQGAVLPPDEQSLAPGDQILFAGTPEARDAQWPMLRNVNVRDYVLKGVEVPGGWIWQKLSR